MITQDNFGEGFSNQAEMTNFMKIIAIAGGFLTLFVYDPGAFSIDSRTSKNTLNQYQTRNFTLLISSLAKINCFTPLHLANVIIK
jgi:hypothetical protein